MRNTRRAIFITELRNAFTGANALSRSSVASCALPDLVDQGIGSVKDLARALEKDGYFFFWWD